MPKDVKEPSESTLMEVALVEFDDNQNAVIMPRHERLDIELPKKLVYVFLDECIDRYANEIGAKCVAKSRYSAASSTDMGTWVSTAFALFTLRCSVSRLFRLITSSRS